MEMEEIVRTLASHSSRLDNLERWQESQNGSIHKVRDEVNEIRKWIMGATLGVALNLLGITATAFFLYLKVIQ